MQLWDVPCIRETYTEDNDTDEDEDCPEMHKQNMEMLKTLHEKFGDRDASIKDIRKGWLYLIEQEKRDLKKIAAIKKAQKRL